MKESSLSGAKYCDERERPSARLGITGPLGNVRVNKSSWVVCHQCGVRLGERVLLFIQYFPQKGAKGVIVFKGLDRRILAQPVRFR